MHIRRFDAAGGLAVFAIFATSACASGDSSDVSDAESDAPLVTADGSAEPDSAAGFFDGGYDDDSSVGDESSLTGSDDSSTTEPEDSGGGNPVDSGGGGMMDTGTVTSTGLSVLYQVQDSASSGAPYIGCELSVLNSSTASVAVSGLEARYYFLGVDETVMPTMTINWSHVSTTGSQPALTVTATISPLQPATAGADTYIAFDLSSGSHPMLAPGESAVFSWQLQSPNTSMYDYTQTSDYSFNASDTTLTSWQNVPIYQGATNGVGGTLVWGAPP